MDCAVGAAGMAITIHGSLAEWTQMRERETERVEGGRQGGGGQKGTREKGKKRQEDGSVMTCSYYNEVILQ